MIIGDITEQKVIDKNIKNKILYLILQELPT